jgi:hypothetical protein
VARWLKTGGLNGRTSELSLPGQFAQYFRKERRLRFAEEPAYAEYREMFRGLFIEMGFVYDSAYDWSSLDRKSVV